VAVLIINYFIAVEMDGAGETIKTLMAMVLALSFGFKIFFIALGLIAFILAVVALIKSQELKPFVIALVLSLVSIALTFLDSWKIWINFF
jgi:hypothetical protein